jgi:Uma2 family endonuclease
LHRRHIPRINYYDNILELMAPLPIHERPHRMIGYIVTALLDAQDRAWEDFGSTTFRKPKQAGLEPDTCFYIQNAVQIRNRERLDMTPDLPPDLAIESDVTSKTTLNAYAALNVPEVWYMKMLNLKFLSSKPTSILNLQVVLHFLIYRLWI